VKSVFSKHERIEQLNFRFNFVLSLWQSYEIFFGTNGFAES